MKRVLLAACVLALGACEALAQAYPSRPVTMIVPFGAGGPTDALARIVAERMRTPLGQAVLVENVTGASGTIGVGRVARAAADGYTMVLGNWPSFVVASATYANLPYDVTRDFEPIAQLPNNPYIVVSKKDLPAKGRFWIEPATGRVLMSELVAQNRRLRATIDVSYQSEPLLGLLVPIEMREWYDNLRTGSHIEAVATYGRFRQFQVNTDQTFLLKR